MSRPPYFRPYGAQAFTRAVSASARILVPRFWRMYLALWLISRWRLPATPILILPVAVSLKRFLTPLLVLSLGIFVSLLRRREIPWDATLSNRHGMPLAGPLVFPTIWKARAYRGGGSSTQGLALASELVMISRPKIMQPSTNSAANVKKPAMTTAGQRIQCGISH